MEFVDMNNWGRKEHFDFFHRADYAQYNICANIDVTSFLSLTKQKGLPFYHSMIYMATQTANEIINFRYRIREDRVVLHDRLTPSFTWLKDEEELFRLVTVELKEDIREFARAADEKARTQTEYFPLKENAGRDDFVYITCIPWVSFTHISHTFHLNKNDSVPRLSWGKYFTLKDKILLPFSVQVNHALVDGVHVGKYYTRLQEHLDNFFLAEGN